MRSRYSAFAVGDADYLLATWAPESCPSSLVLDDDVDWTQLEIVDAVDGAPADAHGIVEFVAYYRDRATGQFGQQRERSAFRRDGGAWVYVGLAE